MMCGQACLAAACAHLERSEEESKSCEQEPFRGPGGKHERIFQDAGGKIEQWESEHLPRHRKGQWVDMRLLETGSSDYVPPRVDSRSDEQRNV